MVRETRHLWVGNLPDNIREDRIREHFKRYGRVQSVKLLPRSTKEETGEGAMACTVAFMDIKSASKAHNTEHKVDDRTLTTEYYEPAAIPSSASPQTTTSPYSTSPGSTRFPNGHSSSDEHGPFAERFYDRPTAGGGRVADGSEFIRRTGGSGYHDAASRSRTRDRGFRNGPYNVVMDRGSHRTIANSWSYDGGGGGSGGGGRFSGGNSQAETGYAAGGAATAATATAVAAVSEAGDRRGTSDQSTKKKTKSRSGSRSPSPSGSTSSRSPSRSRSRSSSSSSSSSSSRTSSTITPISRRTAANSHLAHSDDRRPLAICVRNLPLRSSDTSLKDGLYHEYKKHGKVTSVKVVGQNSERHAIVCFKKPEDVEKALEVSYDKLFFGCKIDVASYQGFDVEDNDLRPYEAEIDEFHPKATRTLFIGNLEKDTTASDLRKHFDQFGEIIEIDIKNQGNVSLYAFCQYSDIVSVVKAIRKMDGEHLGNNRIKLGFGKSMPTNVVWVDGIVENVNEKYLRLQFDPFGPISKVNIDRDRGQALIFYEQMVGAQSAVSKMRGYSLKGSKIQVDFASRECQQSFYEHLEKQAPVILDRVEERRDSTSRSFDSSRFARYDTPTRPRASSYSSRSSITASQVASAIPSPGTPGSVTPRGTSSKSRVGRFNDYYEGGEVNDRHFRSYDEYSQGSAASQDDPYDPDYSYNHHESPMHVDVIESRSATGIIPVDHAPVPYAPPDIRNLQKERVHLLEQLEDCPSSGDEHIVSKKRLKLDLLDNALGTDVIIEANRDHRKVMEVRRLSDVSLKHHSRRPSADNKHSRDIVHERSTAYIPHGICKRRKTGSDSGSRNHHYEHSGSESVGGSRPGTPLCDERPENFQPSEPRRVPRERNGPLSLPLPRFASQIPGRLSVSIAGIKGQKDVVLSSPPPAVTSPRISNPKPTSPVHVPPPASPPPRPPSLSSNSSDSENPPSPSLDERIKSLDEKYEKWSGSRALSAAGGDALAKLDATREKFRLRHKLLDFDLKEVQPSEIVKSVMAKRSVFDEDLKRLENVGEKYEPKDFALFPRAASIIQGSCAAAPATTPSIVNTTSPSLQISSVLSPRSSGNNMIPAKGLQYPFPSHPPIQPTTPTLLQQTPPATPSSIASPTPQMQTSSSTTTRSANHGENRLKSCASASSDSRLSSKVNVNRNAVLNNSALSKTSEKNSGNVSGDQSASAAATVACSSVVETKTSRSIKQSDKISSRRDSNNGSPRVDPKPRRNSDVGTRRTEDLDKFSDNSAENDRKTERGKSEERKKEHKEKQRLENEILERERLEKEQQEKERLEKERLEREKQEREKELEKERLEKEKQEKERAERERLEKERQEQERKEQERLKREREEQERLRREKEEAEREKAIQEERQRKEKEETERKERELREKLAEEERQAKKERQARKERHEAERLEKERRREEEKKNKEDNHEKRKDDYKHRENHGENKHKDNNVNHMDKTVSNNEHKYMKQGSKDQKDKTVHESIRKNDSHDRYNSDKYNKHSEKDSEYRRKDSIKENRDNNTHEKLKNTTEVRHMSMELDKPKSDKTKDNNTPANVGIKRRMSSQDNFDHSEAKKQRLHSEHKKISERRDSKDSTRSDEKMKPKLKTSRSLEDKPYSSEKPNSIRVPEEKRKEKDKDREERHRNKQKYDKQKAKSKSREKDIRESPTSEHASKELTDKDFLARLELRSTDDVDVQKEKRLETKEKRRYDLSSNEAEKRDKDDKRNECKKKDKPSDRTSTSEKPKPRDEQCQSQGQSNRSFEEKNKLQKKERIRKPLDSSDSDSDEPRKHSIFDIVDDEPAYISMYDKVKARSCKNMQKQEEEKRQEKIKAKFSQLKQSRAKREEKKRSTSWDEDSDSDRDRNDKSDSKSRRHKMLIVSSDDDSSDFGKSHKNRDVFDDSHSDRQKHTEASDDEVIKRKSSKSSRHNNENSEDYKNSIKSDLFSMSKMEISSYLDINIFKVKDEFRSSDKDRKSEKQDRSYNKHHSDHETTKNSTKVKSEKMNNHYVFSSSDDDMEERKPSLSELRSQKSNNRYMYSDDSSTEKERKRHKPNNSIDKNDREHDETKRTSSKTKSQRFVFSSDDDSPVEKERNVKRKDSEHEESKQSKPQKEIQRFMFSSDDESSVEKDRKEEKQHDSLDRHNTMECKSVSSKSQPINNRYDFSPKDERSIEKERKTEKQEDNRDKNNPDVDESKPSLSEIKSEKVNNRYGCSSTDESTEFKKEKPKKHKKKQKRPKHSLSSEESNKFDVNDSPQNDSSEKVKHHDKKKQHSKKEKKHDKSKERDKSKKSKKSNKTNNSYDMYSKYLFELTSDSSDNAKDNDTTENKITNPFMNLNYFAYTDSEGEREKSSKVDESEREEKTKKRKEKKTKKDKERLQQEAAAAAALAEAADHFNEASMDFADMGKQLEANIKDEPISDKEKSMELNDTSDKKDDVFKYYDNTMYQDFKKEDRKEGREKKKKRKKSKEEKQKHHHHHHHHHHEKSKVKTENKKENSFREEPSTPTPVSDSKPSSQSLPSLLDIPSPPQEKSMPKIESPSPVKIEPIEIQVTQPETVLVPPQQQVQSQVSPVSSKEKKRDKFIPGFGSDIDETIHENAVKSISDFDAIKPAECPKIEDVKLEKPEETTEEKPRVVISQEETEDAVAALLGESFSNEFQHYDEEVLSNTNDDTTTALVEEPTVQDDEEMRQAVQSLGAPDLEAKPETPQSEHELQIDTDTEEQDEINLRFDQQPKTPDMSELLQPPKTPDLPTYYRPEEPKLTPSPLVIKSTPVSIGSPPSLAPITPQPSIITNAKRNLEKMEFPSKIPPLVLPPLVEPARSVIHPWVTKTEEVVSKADTKLSVVTKVSAPQVQQTPMVSTPTPIVTTSPIRTSVVKLPEPSYPPLTAISKPEPSITKSDKPVSSIPILQVTAPGLHNLPARSPIQQAPPSISSQDLPSGVPKVATTISKIRLPITSVMVSKPLQASTINLPQPKVAFTSEPPKLIPTQETRPRMIFQNAGVPTAFPFNANQKMLVQTNIPMARGLLVPARPGHFNLIPSQVAFNTNTGDKVNEMPKTSSAQVPSTMGQSSPTKIIQMKPQSIIISPNSHTPPVMNSPKIIKTLMPDNPPSLVAISSVPEPPTVVPSSSSTSNQTNVIMSNTAVERTVVEKESTDKVPTQTPVVDTPPPKEFREEILPQKLEVPEVKPSEELLQVEEQKEEEPEVKVEEEPKQKLAIETVTEELNKTLTEALEYERAKPAKQEIEQPKVEAKPDLKVEEREEIKPKVEAESPTVKEPEKIEEEKTDSESIVSDISKDCSSADMPIKDLLLDGREDKEDSDYWSPKDVNIDSVIKTLCSADELSNHSNDNMNKEEEDHQKEEQIAEPQKEDTELDSEIKETEKESDVTKSDTETLDDSVEDEDKEVVSRISTRRGGRGRGRKGRGGIERCGIQTRRAKVQPKEPVTPTKRATTVRGGKAKVERKVSKTESESPADIYEFREDEENRPRLILTIKQTNTNTTAIQSAVVKEVPKEPPPPPVQTPPKPVEVKEKAEDFTQPSGSTNTRKSKRLQEKDIFRTTVDDTIEDVVKNVVTRSSLTRRSTRQPTPVVKPAPETPRKSARGRRIGRRASEAAEESVEEKEKPKTPEEVVNTCVDPPKPEVEKSKDVTASPQVALPEKEEIKQPPVTVKESVVEKPPIGLKAAVLRRIKGEMGQEPMTLIDPVTGLLTPMRECEENKYIPVPGENKPGMVVPTTQTPVVTPEVKPVQPTVITSSQQTIIPTVKVQSKPQSLKAHVLSSQAAQAVVTQQVQTVQKQNAVIASSAPSPVGVEMKITTQPSQSLSVNVCMPNFIPAHASPRTNLTITSSSPKPATVKQPVSSPGQMYNLLSQQMMHMNKTSSPTVVPKGIVSSAPLMAQQSIIKQVPLNKSVMAKKSHPMHIPPGVPSSVLGKIPSQTIVSNTSRMKNMMEPPKVDVSLNNLMSVRGLSSLSPQGQPRHHAQPVSGYEASLAETIPHFPPGSVTLRPHDLPPPHYMHPSHVMYQQYLRQSYHFPRSSVVSGGIEKPGDGQEGEEAPVTSPPLELRISNSAGLALSSRGAAVPHSLHSPHDRATDSPQIGQVYNMPTARMQHYNLNRYYEPAAEPPPAHRPVTSHTSLAALGSDRPPLSHLAALGAPDRSLVSHLPPDKPLGSHLPHDRSLGSHLPPDRPHSGHSALAAHLPLGNPERPSSSHLPPDRPTSSHLTPDRLSGISTPDRPVSAHTMTLGAGLGAAGNLMGAVARHIGVDAPTSQRGLQAATPPHASQVPPQAESLNILLKQYPKMWQGLLALKNDQAAVHMYFISGNDYVARCSLPKNTDGSTPPLRIFQRMRLEPPQVEGVARKMQMEKEHCCLLALPCGMDHMDVLKQSNNLTNGFIHYLQQKQAAGIVNVAAPGTTQPPAYVVHIFPTCNFVEENLRRLAPSLLECVSDIAHLLIVITTV